jgi:hypothetical protein
LPYPGASGKRRADKESDGGIVMSLACLLGLLIGAEPVDYAPPYPQLPCLGSSCPSEASPPERAPRPIIPGLRRRLLPESPCPSVDASLEPEDADPSQSPWVSARERWCRRHAANTVALLDVLTLYADIGDWDERPPVYSGGFVIRVVRPRRDFAFVCQPAFAPLLLESLQIRTSDRSPADKGRQIAKLIKPWMTWQQIHALFGESKAIIWHHGSSWITYVDYGVAVDRDNRVICRDDAYQPTDLRWDWVTRTEEEEQARREQVFNFFMSFTR